MGENHSLNSYIPAHAAQWVHVHGYGKVLSQFEGLHRYRYQKRVLSGTNSRRDVQLGVWRLIQRILRLPQQKTRALASLRQCLGVQLLLPFTSIAWPL